MKQLKFTKIKSTSKSLDSRLKWYAMSNIYFFQMDCLCSYHSLFDYIEFEYCLIKNPIADLIFAFGSWICFYLISYPAQSNNDLIFKR
ncbi:hypothetical protein BpHYR1_007756 [Brachionus plicatilis]|uniref:Uncharacterized protein n=1 Tax=Brachionus plicatilis TaxID=10195 RepID=A0A3M7RP20_BRAPC|nr:hypothetical protein BpHYR1_007756 [Brachionus plicatilis]